jgi:hypothetical protein
MGRTVRSSLQVSGVLDRHRHHLRLSALKLATSGSFSFDDATDVGIMF